jgi:Mg/Co/Ni transporter MgtE
MIFQQHYFYLCKTPLSAQGERDVEIVTKATDSAHFPEVFKEYETLRSHAFNQDQLYSIVRADDIYDLVRAVSDREAKEKAWEKAKPEIVTNLQHRVMQSGDKNAEAILKDVHDLS